MAHSLQDFIPPEQVARNARKGLKLRESFGRGGTHVGVARAHQLSSGDYIDPETIQRMVSYFARHEVDKKAKNFAQEDNPSAGYIAWLLWGGDEGRTWAENLKKSFFGKNNKKHLEKRKMSSCL
jgi:hypothetical protein